MFAKKGDVRLTEAGQVEAGLEYEFAWPFANSDGDS
jgi:hypothetical protein